MATPAQWLEGARLRTLPAAASPVLVGSACALGLGAFSWWRAALALLVALAMQVGVNFSNDYSDGVRGTDDVRVGPLRLTASGAASPGTVKRAAFAAYGVAMLAGLVLVAVTGAWWLVAVGAACVVAGWLYTGGPKPYGYLGLGEVFVFVFFGLVATLGTTWVQAGTLSAPAWAGACAVGLFSCAVLMLNNLRDLPRDAEAGKRTLAVRLGDRGARGVYAGMVLVPFALLAAVIPAAPWTVLAMAPVFWLLRPVVAVWRGASGLALVPALRDTGLGGLAYSALFLVGFWLG